ncbi:MAG: MFS transporter [Paracoccaceae bacterium]|nr:MFS transporter [Paracoccaceae bacterium]
MTLAANLTDARSGNGRARRNVVVLVAGQAVLGSQLPMMFTMGGLAGQQLAKNPCFATLPISLIVLGSMLTSMPMSALMQRYGRRAGFLAGAAGGATGGILATLGLYLDSFPVFLCGSLASGVFMSSLGYYRFAAADTADDDFRPKAISYVMAGGLAQAVIGPQLFKLSADAFPIPFLGAYGMIVVINIVGPLVFLFLDIPKPAPRRRDRPYAGRSRMELLASPKVAVAIICAMVSYALMNLVMTATPLAVVGCGFSQNAAADVVMAHILAMFAPSFFTGHLIVRFGAHRIVATGLTLLLLSGAAALSGQTLINFHVALILLGIGWNFGFIGGTTMLTTAHTPEERGRAQGLNEFFVFGLVTLASLASGGLMNCSGGTPQSGWTTVILAMIPFLALASGSLLWLRIRRPA